jgi:D-glutamate cyclase
LFTSIRAIEEVTVADLTYAKTVDALVSAAIRPKKPALPNETLYALHAAGAELVAEPMPLAAARQLIAALASARHVFLLTGAYDPVALPFGETDGPPGVAVMARALDVGFGAKPVVVCEEPIMRSIELTSMAARLLPVRDPEHARQKAHTVMLEPFPIASVLESQRRAEELLNMYEPVAIIAIERLGWNAKKRYHYAGGTPMPRQAYLECLFEKASESAVLTIAVGDGGNEIGMGSIIQSVRENVPAGRRCRCECEAGTACTVTADRLVVANTSNLGAYGIVACMGLLADRSDLIHTRSMEDRLLEAVASAGCMDAGFVSPSVDGGEDSSRPIVELLHRVVDFACR